MSLLKTAMSSSVQSSGNSCTCQRHQSSSAGSSWASSQVNAGSLWHMGAASPTRATDATKAPDDFPVIWRLLLSWRVGPGVSRPSRGLLRLHDVVDWEDL